MNIVSATQEAGLINGHLPQGYEAIAVPNDKHEALGPAHVVVRTTGWWIFRWTIAELWYDKGGDMPRIDEKEGDEDDIEMLEEILLDLY